jgi:hypothetical protein
MEQTQNEKERQHKAEKKAAMKVINKLWIEMVRSAEDAEKEDVANLDGFDQVYWSDRIEELKDVIEKIEALESAMRNVGY